MESSTRKRKIAILGGGMAGLTSAFQLTSEPDWQEKYEITIYQIGWRLGGKCATGRGANGRIEEHGIHAFSGCYYNALGMMWACYQALPKIGLPDGAVLKSFTDAFEACDAVVMWEVESVMGSGDKLVSWPFDLTPNDMTPADYDRHIADLEQVMAETIRLARRHYYAHAGRDRAPARPREDLAAWWRRTLSEWGEIRRFLALLNRTGMIRSMLGTLIDGMTPKGPGHGLLQFLHRLPIMTNYVNTLWRGIFCKDYDIFASGFDVIDDIDFFDWLKSHGGTDAMLSSPLAYNTVDLSYNYPFGDNSMRPAMAAGSYLRWSLRMLLNLGSFGWSFKAGTGETIIAPLYHVLKARGVRFEFFHKVTALRLAEDRQSIARIEVDVQAELNDPAAGYDPLVPVKGLLCWPNKPRFEQLVDGKALEGTYQKLKADSIDMESYWCPVKYAPRTLEVGRDFDTVVLALSVGALPYICEDLIAQDYRWRLMVDGVPACATQTMQIWMNKSSDDMDAWRMFGRKTRQRHTTISGTFIDPFNGQADFTDLIEHEDWPDPPPKSLWYFTGAMALDRYAPFYDAAFPGRQNDRVKYQAVQFLQATVGYLLPNARTDWDPIGLDFNLLVCPGSSAPHETEAFNAGVNRFDYQFWRANIDPTERYVQAPKGSTRVRLTPDDSGFDNLVLAGDWVYNGLNVGSVEGAVMGGKLAALAVAGSTDYTSVIGYRPRVPGTGA
jgi:uncharacterized protein with NAD-binding domain and iron-sulfur cluster